MSPEQVKGLPLDARSDLFSFGVMLAEMTSGRHPFRKPSTIETCSAVLSRTARARRRHPSGSDALLLQRLLAKEAADRYASIADVRADLAALADDVRCSLAARKPVAARRLHAEEVGWPSALSSSSSSRRRIWDRAFRGLALRPPPAGGGDRAWCHSIDCRASARQLLGRSEPGLFRRRDDRRTDDRPGDDQPAARDLARLGDAVQRQAQRPPTPEIARLLNVDAIVEGSVVRVGDTVRITAQLIDARADKHLWARSFERNSRDVLALQDELASAIAGEINVQLTPTEQSRLTAAPA